MKFKVKLLMANGNTIIASVDDSEIEKAFDKQAAKSEYVKARLIGGVAVHFHAEHESKVNAGDTRYQKPPLGIMEESFFYELVREERYAELCGAIMRYVTAGMKVSEAWITEYNKLAELCKVKEIK